MNNAQEMMESQAAQVQKKQNEALTARMKHGLEKIQLEKDKAVKALALKVADPKIGVAAIESSLAVEFEVKDTALLKLEEAYKTADIQAEYESNLLSILKIVASRKE